MCVSRICLIPGPVFFSALLSKVLIQTQDFVVRSRCRGRKQAGKAESCETFSALPQGLQAGPRRGPALPKSKVTMQGPVLRVTAS